MKLLLGEASMISVSIFNDYEYDH